MYGLVAGQYATYYEIKYLMTIWDVLDLVEIMIVKESNIGVTNDAINEKLDEKKI